MSLIRSTKNGKPLYRVRWNYRRDPDTGKRRFDERVFRKLAEARAFDRRTSASTSRSSERITVAEATAVWLELRGADISQRTRKGYEIEARVRIGPTLGGKRLASITAVDVTRAMNDLIADGHSRHSVNKFLVALKAMNRWCRGRGLSENRGFDDVGKLKVDEPEQPEAYAPADVARIAAGFDLLRDATLITVAAYSGLRWGELVVLEWSAVNLAAESIVVFQALDLDGSRKIPKGRKPRTVPVLAPGVAALKAWRDACPSDARLVFPSRTGTPLGTSWYKPTGPLGRARKACGIHFQPHQMRDTFASILIATGAVGMMELGMVVGHQSVQTTRKHYAGQYDARVQSITKAANRTLKAL